MKEIFERRSIRRYTAQEVSDNQITELLRAAMAAPSAGNGQPWEFIVLRNKQTFQRIMEVHPYSKMLQEAQAAIVICCNTSREIFNGYWVQDCAAATQNIQLMAKHMGLGSVWLGVYPMLDRVAQIKEILSIPEFVIPLSIVPIGYPAETKACEDRFMETKVHYEHY